MENFFSIEKLQKENIEEKFKESKVRDEDGKLLVVYHFSDDKFDNFSSDFSGKNYEGDKGFFGDGIYFTSSKEEFHYGKNRYAAYLNLRNPLIIKNPTVDDVSSLNGRREEFLSQGYDGVMIWNDEIKDKEVTVFGKTKLIKGKKAGWSEIVVFDPINIHKIEDNKENTGIVNL